MKRIIACLLALGCLSGCDPLRRISMENKTGNPVTLLWTLSEQDSLWANPFFYSGSEVVRFDLYPNKPRNKVNMSFGVGSWSLAAVKILTGKLKCLQIIQGSGTTTFAADSSVTGGNLTDYLLQRRKGLDKSKIKIVLK